MPVLRRTPLYDAHVAAGARMVDFAGWEMPVQYTGVSEEHLAVRSGCGVFDVSHMGEVEIEGPGALEALQKLLSNDVSKLAVRGAQYSCLCQEDGGVLDDLFTYRLADEHYLIVTNASNHDTDYEWIAAHADEFDCHISDHFEKYAMLAVQGPKAREIVSAMAADELPPRHQVGDVNLSVGDALVCGTGYTGEDGVEILVPPDSAAALWETLVVAGATPAGLGARDTLRMEVGYCLYGNDLTTDRTPIEAGLGWCCSEDTGFIGSEACRAAREAGPAELLVPFKLTGPGIPRQGNPVLAEGEPVGQVTSGTHSPSLEAGIGMAYVPKAIGEAGTEIEIDVRGKLRPARVEQRPLYSAG